MLICLCGFVYALVCMWMFKIEDGEHVTCRLKVDNRGT